MCDKDAIEYMQKLNNVFSVDILTVRPERVRAQLIHKLNDLGIKKGIHYNNAVFVPYDPRDAKIKLYDYDIYVDDNPNLVNATNNDNGKILLLYDQPWNREFVCNHNVIRVHNWKEVYNTIIEVVDMDNGY